MSTEQEDNIEYVFIAELVVEEPKAAEIEAVQASQTASGSGTVS